MRPSPAEKPPQDRQIGDDGIRGREQQLADAQQIAQLGSWEWDVRTTAMSWSDEFFRIAGCAPGSLVPSLEAFLGGIHPEDRGFVERRIQEALLNRSCLEFEYRIVRPDGGIRSVHCRAEVIVRDPEGPLRMIGTAHDVTELRHFASALTSQVEQLQQLTQASVAIYSADGVEEILEIATGHALRIIGARVARATITDPRHERELAAELCRDAGSGLDSASALAGLGPFEHPLRIGIGQPNLPPCLANLEEPERAVLRRGWLAVPLVDLIGGASGSIQLLEKGRGDFTDGDEAILVQIAQITSLALQKARLFDRLQASEERYRRLFDAHLSGDFLATMDGTFLEVNPALSRILGYPGPEALKAARLANLYADPGEEKRLVERIRTEGGAIQHEAELLRADGTPICVILQTVGLRDRAGELFALQGCLFDVTEWKRAESALRESQQQLLQAQKMEAVGQLAGGIAHDFNNMLMAIQGFANLLDEEMGPTSTGREYLGEIRKAADRSARLTRQLLAYSRKQVLQPEILDLNGAVTGIEDMLRRLIGAHITFISVLDPEAGRVHADPVQLQQVLMNLVLNARDAMPDGGRLIVRTKDVTMREPTDFGDFTLPAGRYSTLTVTDTGCGIPPEILSRIYEPFFTTKGLASGSGLGLSTVYGIVKQSGGYIRAESRPGEGTSFVIYLPRTHATATDSPGAAPDAAIGDAPAATVLVAEDESVLRSLAAIVLRRSGFQVLEAEDGVEALELARANGYAIDVLVTDLVMPRLGGHALAGVLLEHQPELKVVFMSGYADEAIARHGLLREGSTFLEKPFSPSVLARAVRDILDARPRLAAPPIVA